MPENNDPNASLSDQATFQGQAEPKIDDLETRSLGDQATFAGAGGDNDYLDDGMEIVDLTARYKIEKSLGKGGMGEVLLATDTRLNRKVAIKRILSDAARNRTAVNRFLTEAKSIAALNHPNVVQIYDYGRAKDGPFLIMEYVDGSSLLDRCREGAIPLEESIDLVCQLCDGLGRAHERFIIHRDIKPANILLTLDGIPKLTDFGLAKAETADTGMTMAGAVLGTLDFMPPEQRRDASQVDARSDLWSLAATLYQMVTGKRPTIIKINEVPKSLQNVLGKALEDRKEDRYQSAKELKQAVKQSLTTETELNLNLGECPHCGTKNETNRKFCKKCAQSLEVACLSCQITIPIWEEVCGQCGTKQSELLEKYKQEMAAQRDQAEQLLEKLEFQVASQLARVLGNEADPRLQHLKGWSQKFLQQLEKKNQEEIERLAELVGEALKHEQAYDYPSAVHALEQVPGTLQHTPIETLQGTTAAKLMQGIQKKREESQRLENHIRQRISARQVNGLEQEVDQFLALRPDHTDMRKLKQQLVDRQSKLLATRDEAFATAKQLYESHEYERCITEISRIDASLISDQVAELQQKAKSSLDRLHYLRATIATRIKEKNLQGLLTEVEECITLQPSAADLIKLRNQLREQDTKTASKIAELIEKASAFRDHCQFQEAVAVLERIPKGWETNDSTHLKAVCQGLALDRRNALQALNVAMSSKNFGEALASAAGYADQLQNMGLIDLPFTQAYQSCQQGFEERQEAVRHMTALIVKVGIAAAALTTGALLVAAGFWVHNNVRANAIATSLEQQKWDNVLTLDPENVTALIGRANSRLKSATPTGVADAFTDLEMAERLDASASGLPEAKATAYAMRAKAYADDGKLAEAGQDLRDAIKLQAAEDLLLAAKQSLAEAEAAQRRAEAEAIKKKLELPPIKNSIGMELTLLPPGKVVTRSSDSGRSNKSPTPHEVTLTQSYYIGVHEVTQEQYKRVMGTSTSRFKGDQNPVENVSWDDAVDFCKRLSELPEEKKAGRVYRLPTEAEWEYACRAGSTSAYCFGDGEARLGEYAWFSNNSRGTTHPVGQKKPNAWGLFDMHGNVWEWCSDWYDDYPKGAVTDPVGPKVDSFRVGRGGGWGGGAALCRSAFRGRGRPSGLSDDFGFRVALSSSGIPESPEADK